MLDDVDALLFDLDDTLMDHRGAADRAVAEWARTLPGWHGDDRQTCSRWTSLEREHFPKYERGECTLSEQRRLRLRAFSDELADLSDAAADRCFADYLHFYEQLWAAIPGAASLIAKALDSGLKVGVLTNGDRHQQRRKLAHIGLLRPELTVFTSGELGVAKPAIEAYKLACSGLGTPPSRTVMIGDNHRNDVVAAIEAGLRAIHFDRANTSLYRPAFTTLAAIEGHIFGGARV